MNRKDKYKILVVDDDPGTQRFLTSFFTQKNYIVYSASSGMMALEIVESLLPDLILLDIMMPEINGFDVCRKIKENEPTNDIPVIFISTMQEVEDQVKAFQAGGVDYITKPLHVEEVLARVNTHLALKDTRQQLQAARDDLEKRVIERTKELERANANLQAEIEERISLEKAILDISEREQQRIGHDLHDDLGQLLTGIAFMADTLYQQLKLKFPSEAESASKIAELVNEGISKTSRLARGLYPVTLQKGGLISALQELANNAGALYNVPCKFSYESNIDIKNPETAIHLYRITQEAVNNAIKHSKASNILIDISQKAKQVTLIIRDNGIGFSKNNIGKTGLGLQTMHYRAKVIKATIKINEPSNGGTVVTCSFINNK